MKTTSEIITTKPKSNMAELIISFPDQSKSFTYGVEFGRIYEQLGRGDDIVKNHGFPVRIENKELIDSACKHHGYEALWGSEIILDGWITFRAIKKTNIKEQHG